jgi:hypothetical protein
MEIPSDAQFLGYPVHREDRDDFLVGIEEQAGATNRFWSVRPQDAQVYSQFSGAHEAARRCEGSVVVGIFDTEDKVWVGVTTRDVER